MALFQLGKKGAFLPLGGLLLAFILLPGMLTADPFMTDGPAPLVEVPLPQKMEVKQRDSHNWVVLECGVSCGYNVLRNTKHYQDGSKSEQVTRVLSPFPGSPPLNVLTDQWNRGGELVLSQREIDKLDDSGVRIKGSRDTQDYEHGRTVEETVESWNPSMKSWLVTRSSTVSYYPDGDMKERITENIKANRKSDERWGPKGPAGRVKTVRHWDAARQAWGQ
ncbi:MAG TPA: hypothetical protein VK786_02430 [bacterium]|nr:hypothetical protein [bacterium]